MNGSHVHAKLMEQITFDHRSLSRSEAESVSLGIKETYNIIGYSARELQQFNNVIVALHRGEMVGLVVGIDLLYHWSEIALIFVVPSHRDQGIGKLLFEQQVRNQIATGRHVFVCSRNDRVVLWMQELGFQPVKFIWQLPFSVHIHMIRFIAHPYRIRELVRKLIKQPHNLPFLYGTIRCARNR